MMISCLSPELNSKYFFSFSWNKLGRELCCFQERAEPFSVLMHQLDSMPKVQCRISGITQACWTSFPRDRQSSG